MKKSELIFTAILVPADFLMLLAAGLTAYFIRTHEIVSGYRPVLFYINLPLGRYFMLVITMAIVMLIVFALVGLYQIKIRRYLLEDLSKIIIGVSAGAMGLVLYIFLAREWFESRFIIVVGWLLAIIFVFLGRFLVGRAQRYFSKKTLFGSHSVLIIGRDGISRRISKIIKEDPSLGYRLADVMEELDIGEVRQRTDKKQIEEVILADPDWPRERVLRLVDFCENNHLIFKFVPNLFQTLTINTRAETLETIPLIEIKRSALDGWGRIIKRLFDIVFAFLFLFVFSPVHLLIALLIKLDSPGPIIYKDYRYGYRKKKFVFYKFRSMRADLCDGEFGTKKGNQMLKKMESDHEKNLRQGSPLHKIEDDPRITKIGRFLRKYSLDELPQFLNVLKGDMSVVGYRPHMSYEVERYETRHQKMFCAKPGVTGLAQISGRSDLDFDEEVRLDLFYIENWSFFLDIIIIIKTLFVVFFKGHKN